MKKFEGMLLACDMDGTLLDSHRQIAPADQEALRYFVEQGGRFTLATGRAPKAIEPYKAILPFNAPYSLLNGSLLLNERHDILHCAGMPEETKTLIDQTLSNFSQNDLGCEIFVGGQVLVRRMSRVTEQHIAVLDLPYTLVSQQELGDTRDWCKINFTGDPVLITQVQRFLQPYRERFCMASSMPSFWEITTIGVNKGTTLLKIADRCGIRHDRVFAVGDSFNDEAMLQSAQIGFAPANADQGILERADVVVCSNDEHAVAAVIDHLETRFF